MATDSVQERFDDLLFHVNCSVKYHARRRRHFENLNNGALFFAFLFSTATMSSLLGSESESLLTELPAIFTSVLVGVTLVGRVAAKASDHNDLKRRFIRLQQAMERGRESMNQAAIAGWWEERLEIEADEAPINRVVHALCYNEVVKSQKRIKDTDKKYVKILARHWVFGRLTRAFDDSLKLEAGPTKGAL